MEMEVEAEPESILSPELLGPVFKTETITLRQALYDSITHRKLSLLATFVPDELILLIAEQAKLVEHNFAILLLLDVSSLYALFDRFSNCQNNGSSGLSYMFNLCTSTLIEQIYINGGDVLQLSNSGILSMWKQNDSDSVPEAMRRVISCAFALKEALRNLENDYFDLSEVLIKSAISAGSLTFVEIGNSDVRHHTVVGDPMVAITKAIKLSNTSDVVLTTNAWKFCNPSDYVHVIDDKNYISITKVLEKQSLLKINDCKNNVELICKPDKKKLESIVKKHHYYREISKAIAAMETSCQNTLKKRECLAIARCKENEKKILENRLQLLDSCGNKIDEILKSFVILPVLKQIEDDQPLEHLTEMKIVTIAMIEISSSASTDLIFLADYCHAMVTKVCEDVGWIEGVSLYESSIVFRIVFGIRGYLKNLNYCRFGVKCAWVLLNLLRRQNDVDKVSVGVATGMVCCMAIGHVARRQYTFIGPPFTKAELIMLASTNKVSCDHDTVIYSEIKNTHFVLAELIDLEGHPSGYIFSYTDISEVEERLLHDLKTAYPILGRFEELDLFSSILDDIGLPDRSLAGIVIEGQNRAGKSRVLDMFATIARARQIKVIKVALHPPFTMKPYSTIHKVLKQILGADDCKSMVELEREVVKKLSSLLPVQDFCYLNKVLRVQFQMSEQYIVDSDWDRHNKTIGIFDKILKMKNQKLCILLDDVHFMDYMSWQFLTYALANKNVIMAMTILEIQSWQRLSRVEVEICKDQRLLRRTLTNLELDQLPVLVCQFLNVQALSTELHDFILKSGTKIPGWFEMFLSLMIVCNGIDVVHVTPSEVTSQSLVFLGSLLSTRIEAEVFPDEVAPAEPWNKKNKVPVCVTNENFRIAEQFRTLDISGLASEIFTRLSVNEQHIVRCAAVLGKAFVRRSLEIIVPNNQSWMMSSAIEKLMRARIFECASLQKQRTGVGELAVCSFEPRITFSDMHHLLRCLCQLRYIPPPEADLARYAHCRFMEFKVGVFRDEMYDNIPEPERKRIHEKIVDIYKIDARKCTACGGGPFLQIPGKDKPKKASDPSVPIVTSSDFEPLVARFSSSTLTVNSELQEDPSQGSSDGEGTSFETNDADDLTSFSAHQVIDKPKRARKIFRKNSQVHPLACDEIDLSSQLYHFKYMDLRNCYCLSYINCVYARLQYHLDCTDSYGKIIDFEMEYAAALINHGQPGYALSFLAKADEKNDFSSASSSRKKGVLHRKTIKRSTILCLRGKAYLLLGNYPQAKTNFCEALSLYKTNFTTNELLTGYRTMYEQMKQTARWLLIHPLTNTGTEKTKHEQKLNVVRQNTAMSLSLVSTILVLNHRPKAAKLASTQSIVFGFSSFDPSNFYNQCQLYLTFAKIYGQLGQFSYMKQVEEYVLFVIRQKKEWHSSGDIEILMHVYACIFNTSWIRGYLGKAVHFGEKALTVAKAFHAIRVKFKVLVSLIQTLMCLKRVCETIDMLQQLRDYSVEDIDKSALTWYYALCVDLFLDTGLLVESFESCSSYACKILAGKSGYCVTRDPRGFKRLVAGLWLWQLRKGDLMSMTFVQELDFFMHDVVLDDCSQIITLCKILECHLLLLTRCINMKRGSQMEMLLVDIKLLLKTLDKIVGSTNFIKPRYLLLCAYFSLLHSDTVLTNAQLRRAKKFAESQMNAMTLAWIVRNKTTWSAVIYNNMASYWEENLGCHNAITWQDLDTFDLNDWSNILYSLPIPDSYI